MRRIAFVFATASLFVWSGGRAQTPCPVPQLSVEGGTSAATPCPPPSTSYTTSFNVTENPLSEGGKWSTGKATGLDWNNPETASGRAVASVRSGVTGSRYDDSVAHLRSTFIDFQPNQYAQGTVYRVPAYAPSGKHEVELLLRFDITAHNARGYEVLWGWDGDFAIVRWNGPLGDYTPLYSAILEQLVDGDVVRAEITAGVVRVYKNGALKATGPADSAFADGQPGIGFWPVDNSTPANYGWKDFEAGNL
jgi:hypothetical protein